MSHENQIVDPDKYFKVDPVTRKITDGTAASTVVMQYDHNSERLTFLVPRFVENHDMLECNKAEVHYSITDSVTKERTVGVYEIDDLKSQYYGENENVTCTWLLSQNVTKIVGSLKFVLRFSCVKEDGTIEYAWSTAVCEALNIESGIYNSEAIIELYPDALERWKSEVVTASKEGVVKDLGLIKDERELDSITEPGLYAYGFDMAGDGSYALYSILEVSRYYLDTETGWAMYSQLIINIRDNLFKARQGDAAAYSEEAVWTSWEKVGELATKQNTSRKLEAWQPGATYDVGDWVFGYKSDGTTVILECIGWHDGEGYRYPDEDCHYEDRWNEYVINAASSATKLDRTWTEVGRDEITQADIDNIPNVGDRAVKVLTALFEKDIASCVELMAIIRIPNSENTTTANWKVGLLTPVEDEPHYGSGWLTTAYGGQSIRPKDDNGKPSTNEVMVRSYFLNGVHIYTQSVVSTTDFLKQSLQETIPRIYEGAMGDIYKPAKLTDKDAYYFVISGDFKLPLGTTMTVYGR